ncbi:MAG: ribonuclease HI [Microgenomates group bacterium Gr01-1014_80]|nr:MAG: ribonuclease HI [Microgenomates group bacterium Gr01-1014_80]
MKKLIVYTDGASRGNPGPASYGFTIADEKGKLLHEEGEYIGKTTNNVAEYTAVLEAFKLIREKYQKQNLLQIEVYADSKLLAEQLSGRYKVKHPNLRPLFDQIKILEIELGRVFYTHIPREKNTLADRLANKALDSR